MSDSSVAGEVAALNPAHIIADGMREVATIGTREDWQLWGAFPNTMTLTDLAAHVVSKLADAGYSITPTEWHAKHATTVSGWRIGQTVQVNFDGCKPFTATLINENPPNRIEVRDGNGDVMFVHASIVTDGEKP